ncbi:response regulator [Falsiroseomonas sp. E2-1-a20]|uniref:response regulator n=1 Tax=Falsiroseomonas sp. E2-1-a20 TaxID=3239300 RepID=UPI003F2A3CCF
MSALDRDLLDAFVPEFEAEAVRLAMVREAPAASRALDQMRAMAAALGAASLATLVDRASQALEALDWPALHRAAEALARQARAVGEAGGDVALAPEPPAQAAAPEAPAALVDAEMLAALAPEFAARCDRLASAPDAAAAGRVVDGLRAMAGAVGLASLLRLLDRAPGLLEPFDQGGLHGLSAELAAQAARIVAAGADVPEPVDAPRKRVLVVDDSAMMRRLVRETLALDADFEVVGEAPDGLRALEALRDLAPDLTMLDIEMPELDGMGVLRRWALEGGGAVVIVSSAARPGSATAVEARRLGVAGIVGKPSGALSPDLRERQGVALLRTARRAAGLPVEAAR